MALFSYSGADERTRTSTSLTLVPKTSASTSSATSAYSLTIFILAHFDLICQDISLHFIDCNTQLVRQSLL